MSTSTRDALRTDVETCGYYPDLVLDSVLLTVGDEEVCDFVVHHEPTFNHDQIHRHLTILVLTPTRLVVGHTDDHTPEGHQSGGSGPLQAATSAESVPLRAVDTVTLTRVVTEPDRYHRDAVTETWLTLNWGSLRRIELEPATCADPSCDADHGFSGSLVGDDLVVRMSSAADGKQSVDRLIAFGLHLQRATA